MDSAFSEVGALREGADKLLPEEFSPDTRIVFFHLAKTGGTSIHDTLEQTFPARDMCPERIGGIRWWSPERLKQYKCFSFHGFRADLDFIPKPYRVFTFLRDPIDRLVSNFEYLTSMKDEFIETANIREARLCKEYGWRRALDKKNEFYFPYIWNPYAVALVDDIDVRKTGTDVLDKEEIYQRAVQALDSFDFVGLTENIKGDYAEVCRTLNIPNRYADKYLNHTRKNAETNPNEFGVPDVVEWSPDIIEMIKERLSIDERLYNYIVKKRLNGRRPARELRGSVHQAAQTYQTYDGRSWANVVSPDIVIFGPYIRLNHGTYEVEFSFRLAGDSGGASAEVIAEVDCVSKEGTVTKFKEAVLRSDFSADGFCRKMVKFSMPHTESDVEFRAFSASPAVWVETSTRLAKLSTDILG